LNIVKTFRRAVLLLLLVSFSGVAGIGALCSSCAPGGEMDCCKPSSSKLPTLEEPSCCEFQVTSPAEVIPAIAAKQAPSPAGFDLPAPEIASAHGRELSGALLSSAPPLQASNPPPLFLLHGSLLR
jgi:hypothetical protein